MIFSHLSKQTRDDAYAAFDPDHDLDLIAAVNEARTPTELDAATRMARSRFAARAKAQPRVRGARGIRRFSSSTAGR